MAVDAGLGVAVEDVLLVVVVAVFDGAAVGSRAAGAGVAVIGAGLDDRVLDFLALGVELGQLHERGDPRLGLVTGGHGRLGIGGSVEHDSVVGSLTVGVQGEGDGRTLGRRGVAVGIPSLRDLDVVGQDTRVREGRGSICGRADGALVARLGDAVGRIGLLGLGHGVADALGQVARGLGLAVGQREGRNAVGEGHVAKGAADRGVGQRDREVELTGSVRRYVGHDGLGNGEVAGLVDVGELEDSLIGGRGYLEVALAVVGDGEGDGLAGGSRGVVGDTGDGAGLGHGVGVLTGRGEGDDTELVVAGLVLKLVLLAVGDARVLGHRSADRTGNIEGELALDVGSGHALGNGQILLHGRIDGDGHDAVGVGELGLSLLVLHDGAASNTGCGINRVTVFSVLGDLVVSRLGKHLEFDRVPVLQHERAAFGDGAIGRGAVGLGDGVVVLVASKLGGLGVVGVQLEGEFELGCLGLLFVTALNLNGLGYFEAAIGVLIRHFGIGRGVALDGMVRICCTLGLIACVSNLIGGAHVLVASRCRFSHGVDRVVLNVDHADDVAHVDGLSEGGAGRVDMVGTLALGTVRVVRSVVDAVVDGVCGAILRIVFIGNRLCRQRIAVRIGHGNGNGERVEIIDLGAGLVHDHLADVDAALQGVGRGEAILKVKNFFDGAVLVENHVNDMRRAIRVLAHDHRMMRIGGQLEVLVSFALFEDIVMACFDNCIRDTVVGHLRSSGIICRAVCSNHDARGDSDVVGLLPVLALLENNTHRFPGFLIHIVVVAVNLQIERNRSTNILTLGRVERVFPYLKSVQLLFSEADGVGVGDGGGCRVGDDRGGDAVDRGGGHGAVGNRGIVGVGLEEVLAAADRDLRLLSGIQGIVINDAVIEVGYKIERFLAGPHDEGARIGDAVFEDDVAKIPVYFAASVNGGMWCVSPLGTILAIVGVKGTVATATAVVLHVGDFTRCSGLHVGGRHRGDTVFELDVGEANALSDVVRNLVERLDKGIGVGGIGEVLRVGGVKGGAGVARSGIRVLHQARQVMAAVAGAPREDAIEVIAGRHDGAGIVVGLRPLLGEVGVDSIRVVVRGGLAVGEEDDVDLFVRLLGLD